MTPGVDIPDKAFTVDWVVEIIKENFKASGCFEEVRTKGYQWSETFTSEEYLKLLRTYSGHLDLDNYTRETLYKGVREVIERFGGRVTKPMQVVLFHARVKR
jgi:hypothetical protein